MKSVLLVVGYGISISIMVGGCATALDTFDSSNKATPGIPIAKPVMIKQITETMYAAMPDAKNPEYCRESKITESFEYFASSDTYFLKFDPSHFAKGDFEVTLNDKGLATKIAVNSEANTGVDALTGAITSILPFYKLTKAEELAVSTVPSVSRAGPGESASAQEMKDKNCVVKRTNVSFQNLN